MTLRTHTLGPGLAPLSELVFGAASLGGRVSERDGLAALTLALERGVTGIDLARSYGYGEAEAMIGKFLSDRALRDRVVVCTKGGIEPAAMSPLARRAKELARPLLDRIGSLRAKLVNVVAPRPIEVPIDAPTLMRAFAASLVALRTQRIDIYLSHRCPTTRSAYDLIGEALERERARGRIGLWGLSGTVADIQRVSGHAPPPVVQVPGDVFAPPVPAGLATALVMRFQPLGGGGGGGDVWSRLVAAAPAGDVGRERWATEVALRGPIVAGAADQALPAVVICAMNQRAHVLANTEAMAAPRLDDAALKSALAHVRRSM